MFRYLERHFFINQSASGAFRNVVKIGLLAGFAGGLTEATGLMLVTHFAEPAMLLKGAIVLGAFFVMFFYIGYSFSSQFLSRWLIPVLLAACLLLAGAGFTRAFPVVGLVLVFAGLFWMVFTPWFANYIRCLLPGGMGLRLVWFFELVVLAGGAIGAVVIFAIAGMPLPKAVFPLIPLSAIAAVLISIYRTYRDVAESSGSEPKPAFNTPVFAENKSTGRWMAVSLITGGVLLIGLLFLISDFTKSGFLTIKGIGQFFAALVFVRYLFTGFMKHYLFHKLLSYHSSVYFIILSPVWYVFVFLLVLVLSVSINEAIAIQKYSSSFMVLSVSYLVSGAFIAGLDYHGYRMIGLLVYQNRADRLRRAGRYIGLMFVFAGLLVYGVHKVGWPPLIYSVLLAGALAGAFAYRKMLRGFRVVSLKTLQFISTGEKYRSHPPLIIEKYLACPYDIRNWPEREVLLAYISGIYPDWFFKELERLSLKGGAKEVEYVIRMVNKYHLVERLPTILKNIKENPNKVNYAPLEALYKRYSQLGLMSSESDLGVFSQSADASQRLTGVILHLLDKRTDSPSFYNFLQDQDIEVLRTALRGIKLSNNSYYFNQLIRLMAKPELVPYVYMAVRQDILSLFQVSNPDIQKTDYVQRFVRAIKLFPDRADERYIELLMEAISSPYPIARRQALDYLAKSKVQVKGALQSFLLNNMVKHAQNMAWTMSMIREIRPLPEFESLWPAFQWELEELNAVLFQHLTLLHGRPMVDKLRQLMDSNNQDLNQLAIEYFDEILDESVKQVLITLLMPSSFDEKLRNLQYYFLIEQYTPEEAIGALLASEMGQVSDYLRARLVLFTGQRALSATVEQLAALLYSPSVMVVETAAYTLQNYFPDMYYNNIERLNSSAGMVFDKLRNDLRQLRISKLEALRTLPRYAHLALPLLDAFASQMNLLSDAEAILMANENGYPLLFVTQACTIESGGRQMEYNGPVLADLELTAGLTNAVAEGSVALKMSGSVYTIDKESFKLLIFDFPELAQGIEAFKHSGNKPQPNV